jgi:hypothetical protein
MTADSIETHHRSLLRRNFVSIFFVLLLCTVAITGLQWQQNRIDGMEFISQNYHRNVREDIDTASGMLLTFEDEIFRLITALDAGESRSEEFEAAISRLRSSVVRPN